MALSLCGLRDASRRAYEWLRASQRPDGSWLQADAAWARPISPPRATTPPTARSESGTSCWSAGTRGSPSGCGPRSGRPSTSCSACRRPAARSSGGGPPTAAPSSYALLTGSASMYSSLRCAIALAEYLAEPQPDWELAADQLGHAVARHPEAFADKSRFSMDWYYPVLGGPVRGGAARAHLDRGWDTYVVPGLGVRCVNDEPWVTAAETAELAIALETIGDAGRRARPARPDPVPARRQRRLLDRLAVRDQAALPGRAEQLYRGRGRAGRRRAVRRDRRVVAVPRRGGRPGSGDVAGRRRLRLRAA